MSRYGKVVFCNGIFCNGIEVVIKVEYTSGEDGKGVSSIEMPCFLLIPGDNEGDFSC
jgi:hypothetical protein